MLRPRTARRSALALGLAFAAGALAAGGCERTPPEGAPAASPAPPSPDAPSAPSAPASPSVPPSAGAPPTLAGAEWTAVEIDGAPLPEGARAPTATFEPDGIAGFAGCNRYSGSVREPSPGEISLGPLASTQMACPETETRIESSFLASLGKATHYAFIEGRLLVSGADGDALHSVVFTRK